MALKMARFDCTYVHRTGKYNIAEYLNAPDSQTNAVVMEAVPKAMS